MPKTAFFSATAQIRSILEALDLVAPKYEGDQGHDIDDPSWGVVLRKRPWRLEYSEYLGQEGRTYSLSLHAYDTRLFSFFSPCADGKGNNNGTDAWRVSMISFDEVLDRAGLNDAMLCVQREAWEDLNDYLLEAKGPYRVFDLRHNFPDNERQTVSSPYMLGLITRILNWFAQQPYQSQRAA